MGSTLSGIAILKTVKTAPNNPKKTMVNKYADVAGGLTPCYIEFVFSQPAKN